MKENKGNKIIIIGVVCLLLVVVVATSYSYFLANAGSSGDASVNVVTKTTNIGDAQLEVVGVLAFDDKDILPGHKNISSIKVTARGSSDKILYNLIWKGSNGLGSPLKFTVYKTNNQVNASVSCDKKIENAHGGRVYFEECSVNNVTNLGSVIKSGEISQGNSKTTLVQNENIPTEEGQEVYYYVVLEYPNLESDQSVDIGGNFQGEVTVEEGQDSGGIGIDTVMAGGEVMDDAMFSGIEGDGLYVWNKGDYSGGTKQVKYYRGNVDNNWVVFGKDGDNYIWWRIIRNNSNGSLRMIYAGTSASKTSAPATTGIVTQIETSAFNNVSDDNMYVGFKYTRGEVHGTGTNSTILDVLNTWYDATIGYNSDYFSKIDVNAGFCNDREPSTNYSELNGLGGTGTTQTYYGVYIRLVTNKMPSLLCTNSDDIFKTNVGLITADEVNMGGIGYNINLKNTGSYLYTNSHYWTMSPFWFIGQDGGAFMSFVHSNGFFDSLCLKNNIGLPQIFGVRPVINLKADTLFEDGGNGSSIAPYVVVGT